MEGINIYKRPKLKNPHLIVAWPGMGEVAFKAASYLVDNLKAEEFAEIPPEEFFYLTGSTVNDGIVKMPELPYSKFYFCKRAVFKTKDTVKSSARKTEICDLIIFLGNAQPDLARAEEYCRRIIQVAKSFRVKKVISMAAMPQPIEHTQEPAVWFAATSKEILDELKKYNLNMLPEGQISGMNGLFLGAAKKEGLPGFCLLGEIPLYTIQIENPMASHAVLVILARILSIQLDFTSLIEQEHTIEGEINKLLDYLKLGAQAPAGPIGEEEIEKIKKSLSQLTKLPASVKESIDRLFILAKADISKANELKNELDKWNVYKEYEDRFLDLFRKPKEKSN